MATFKEINIDSLTPYKNNARTHSSDQIQSIAASIEEFGFINPVIINEDNMIIAGHGRVKAAKSLGMEKVPCIKNSDLTPEQQRAYILADNRLAEDAGWDERLLKIELEELDATNFNIELTGFNLEDFQEIEIVEDEVPEADEEKEPTAKEGDIYQLGRHRLMCGDSTKEETVEKLMNRAKADMVFTDPPYDIAVDYNAVRQCIDNGHILIFNNDRLMMKQLNSSPYTFKGFYVFYHSGCAIPQEGGREAFLAHILISHEVCGTPQTRYIGGEGLRTVIKGEYRRSATHKHEKPQELIIKFIKAYTIKENIIADLFGGSGSTLIACEQLDRACYMMELDPKYVDVIIKRWEDFTGEKATLIKE